MILNYTEQDAIGEVTNISVGAAACYLGDMADVDVDISIPCVSDFDVLKNDNLAQGMMMGYRLSSTSFTAGYCVFVLQDSFSSFVSIVGKGKDTMASVRDTMNKIMREAMIPIEKLIEQPIHVSKETDITSQWMLNRQTEDVIYTRIEIQIVIESKIHAQIVFLYPEKIARKLAHRFISHGVALTTV
ncbi:MAG TPA: hypothetical protein PLZ77_07630 [Lachnospiraceae bacterium]|nr:hypothetical protein [Lachnospiraceae bacterium]HPF29959.1 hypothetical protein [Lachnospiraceae bacterium]